LEAFRRPVDKCRAEPAKCAVGIAPAIDDDLYLRHMPKFPVEMGASSRINEARIVE
jgi:hypothetical protein